MNEQQIFEFFANNNHTGWQHKPQIVEIGSLPQTSSNGDDKFNKKVYIIKNSFPEKINGQDTLKTSYKVCVEVGYLKDSDYDNSKYYGSLQELDYIKDILKKSNMRTVTAYKNKDEGGNDYLCFKSSEKQSITPEIKQEVENIEKVINNDIEKF